MSQNLKSLKEIGHDKLWVGRIALKSEAIKWLKTCRRMIELRKTEVNPIEVVGQIKWIKHFFNITDNDMKGGKT